MSASLLANIGGRSSLGCLAARFQQCCASAAAVQQVRHKNRSLNIKWRKERAQKVFKVELPDMDKMRNRRRQTIEEHRSDMKKEGILPPRTFQERPINISSSSELFEQYVPPEGDGKQSILSASGAKQRATWLEKKGKSYMQLRKIRQFDDDFDTTDFAETAQNIFKDVHHLLQNLDDNEYELHNLVTETAYSDMVENLKYKTLRWTFVETIEPPHVVHVRTQQMMTKENLYAQVTVRMHTRQTLALYDRFGRLMYGNEDLIRDVLEYVVFEKHLSDEYGLWRIHGKIVPEWMPPREPVTRTYRKPVMPTILPDEGVKDETDVVVKDAPPDGTPQLAAA